MIKIDIKKSLFGVHENTELEVNIEIKSGTFMAISGTSGSGKTTLLRILAGLEEAKGEIVVDGNVWLNETKSLKSQKREIGFVFQDYALFNNMSVEENLLFVKKDKQLAKKLLDMTELSLLKDRRVINLSGGQKQRVSLCRAMMNRPKLLLMDEPLSALDSVMRLKLQQEILSFHKEFKTTTLMVSHDPSEIYRVSDRVLVLEHGKIIDDGLAKDVLLKTNGSQKFSFEGELLEINKVDVIYVAVIAIGQQLVEVVVSESEASHLKVGSKVSVSTKAFTPILNQIIDKYSTK